MLALAELGRTDPYSVLGWTPARTLFNLRALERLRTRRARARAAAAGAQPVLIVGQEQL